MGPRRKPLPTRTSFTYEDAVENVRAYLDAPTTPREMRKRLERACGLDHSGFSHRMTQYRGELFRLEHFGAIALEASAPWPWPLVPWHEAERFQAFVRLLAEPKAANPPGTKR